MVQQYFKEILDNIFKKCNSFVLVYIDDVLVFPNTLSKHTSYVRIVLNEFKIHGLVISKKKMELFKNRINFLGFELGENCVKLQDHIVKKVLEFPNNYTGNKKELQRFLNIVNYVRNFILNIGKILGLLYTKVSLKFTTEFNEQDEKLVLEVKRLISNLQPMRLSK